MSWFARTSFARTRLARARFARARFARAASRVGAVLVAVAIAGVGSAASAAPAIADTPPHTWSITMLDGSPATSELFGNTYIVPGEDMTSGYRIVHTNDIDGPLEVRADPISAPSAFENRLSVIVGVNGKVGESVRLTKLLRDGGMATAVDFLPAGPVRLDISLRLDPSATNVFQEDELSFRFRLTVSDVDFEIPNQPGNGNNGPGTGNGQGANGGSGSNGSGNGLGTAGNPLGWGLPATGVTISMGAIIVGIVAIGVGLILLLGWYRRRGRSEPPE